MSDNKGDPAWQHGPYQGPPWLPFVLILALIICLGLAAYLLRAAGMTAGDALTFLAALLIVLFIAALWGGRGGRR